MDIWWDIASCLDVWDVVSASEWLRVRVSAGEWLRAHLRDGLQSLMRPTKSESEKACCTSTTAPTQSTKPASLTSKHEVHGGIGHLHSHSCRCPEYITKLALRQQ
jgi:hypothetical protein